MGETRAIAPPSASALYGSHPRWRDLRRSLSLDWELLGIGALSRPARARLLGEKLKAATAIARGRPYAMQLDHGWPFVVACITDLGTLQSAFVDVHDLLVATGGLRSGGFVVDVGANIGQWTSAVRLFCPSAEVLSLEPDPEVFARLEENVGALPGVECRCLGAGATSGSALLYRHELSLMATLHPDGPGYADERAVSVQVVTIDELVDRPVDVMKVDVEGMELDVLKGAAKTLSRTRFLVVELSLGRSAVGSAFDTLAQVRACAPDAQIVRFGRPIGGAGRPACQDVVIQLHPDG